MASDEATEEANAAAVVVAIAETVVDDEATKEAAAADAIRDVAAKTMEDNTKG